MSIQSRLAKGAITAGLSAAMLFSGVAMPAFAAEQNENGTGLVTIDATNDDAAYSVYQLFKADVNTDSNTGEDTVLRVEGSGNTALDNAVQTFLDGYTPNTAELAAGGMTFQNWLIQHYGVANAGGLDAFAVAGTPVNQIPQNKAEYIGFMIEKSPNAIMQSQTDPVTKQGGSFADLLADVVKANGASPIHATGGTAFTAASEGYFLIVSDQSSVDTDEAGTAVIWTTLGETSKNITPKTAIPTLTKQVKDDTDNPEEAWGEIADANVEEDVSFKIESTLPANYDSFDSYYVKIEDTIPAHMALKGNSVLNNVKVVVVNSSATTPNADITSYLAPNTNNSTLGSIVYSKSANEAGSLVVTIPNLKAQFGDLITHPDSKIIVTYDAHLTAGAGTGTDYNTNTATLEYSADPVDLSFKKTTTPDTANTTCYELSFNKLDKATREKLEHAKFTIKTVIDGTTYYIGENGELQAVAAASAYQFETDANGNFTVSGLDEGTYVIEEVEAPEDYEEIDAPVTIVIDATKDQTAGTLDNLSATYGGGENGAPLPANGAMATKDQDGIVQATPATGLVESNTSDDKILVMPLTGLKASDAALIYGSIAAGISLVVIIRNKRKGAEADDDFELVD